VLASECERLNEAFNHWIVSKTPFVIVKAAITLDGKIATAQGESKWITGQRARDCAMKVRRGVDSVLVGIETVIADNPSLTARSGASKKSALKPVRRIILDSRARTPLTARVVTDAEASRTTIVVTRAAPASRVRALKQLVRVVVAPSSRPSSEHDTRNPRVDLPSLLRLLGSEGVTSLLVEGGGEVNASFLEQMFVQRVVFFYAPKILGGKAARHAVGGVGAGSLAGILHLADVRWRRLGVDLVLEARVDGAK